VRKSYDVEQNAFWPTENTEQVRSNKSIFQFANAGYNHQADYLFKNDPLSSFGPVGALVSSIRFVVIGSQLSQSIKELVYATFGPVTIYAIDKDSARGLSSHIGQFSIIVALFDDVGRAARVFRENKIAMESRLCYAIMTKSDPSVRAKLMRFMFDDVFDARIKPAELITRLQSQRDRQIIYDGVVQNDVQFKQFCDENVEGRVYISQTEILKKLYHNLGKVVRYRDLASYDYHSGDIRLKSLNVRIHKIRKRLKNYEIHCVRGIGYSLVKRFA
jgi:hypothetical protein